MDIEKQLLIVSCLAQNRDLFSACAAIIKPEYFDPTLRKTVKFMQEYFTKFHDAPNTKIVSAETGIKLESLPAASKAELKFLSQEIETFCQHRAVAEAILAGPALLEKSDFGKILDNMKAAISVSLQKDLGIQYFENPMERLKSTLVLEQRISTLIPELDEFLGGGLLRQELILFTANSGGGKSMNMLNLAKNLLQQGLHGVYISLEMGESTVTRRLDSMVTKIGQDKLLQEMTAVAAKISAASENGYGKFYVKRMPENRTNINHVRAYIQQLQETTGFVPDFIIIDYIDIMGTTHAISSDNLFVKDKFVTEEVRSLGFDFDAIVVSASQLGRAAIEADKLTQAHIQGGISKINTSDAVIGVKQDDVLRAKGEIWYECIKARNSNKVGSRSLLRWDPISLTISSITNPQLVLKKSQKSSILGTAGTVFSGAPDLSSLNIPN